MSDWTPTRPTPPTSRLPTAEQVRVWAAEGSIPLPWVIGTLVLCFPVGLFFVWRTPRWTTRTKLFSTGGWALAFTLALWLVAPLLICLTLLGTLAVVVAAIWSSPTLPRDKKPLATIGAVGGFILCVLATVVFFAVRGDSVPKSGNQPPTSNGGTKGVNAPKSAPSQMNPDFNLSRLKMPATFDFSRGPNGEEIRVEDQTFPVGVPTREKWYYYLGAGNEKVKHGLFRAYVDAVVVTEAVYWQGKMRLKNTWSHKGQPNSVQEPVDEQWNRETVYGGETPDDVERALVRFMELKVKKYEGGGSSTEEVWERVLDGETIRFYPNGVMKMVVVYERGKVKSRTLFDTRGKVTLRQ